MELTSSQKDVLMALINIQRKSGTAVKGNEISHHINRNPGTIRNQMQSLKMLGLVEGVPGPKGGYRATCMAYEALNISIINEEATVPIYRNENIIENATAEAISFTTVHHPNLCSGSVKIIGNIRSFEYGDKLRIGPTAVNQLLVRGVCIGRDDSINTILFSVDEIISLPRIKVKQVVKKDPVFIDVDLNINETIKYLIKNKVQGAFVRENGVIIGIVTFSDIGRALELGKKSLKIKNIMTKDLITVDGDTPLYEAAKIFSKRNIGYIVITENGIPKSMLSKTNVLDELSIH
ncbi:MAG: CBS domain-containing protein [Methanosarcinaceae archaeon]|nr:CBS domain-containing protein [Methanosarcinaceae archaeon]